MKKLCTLLAAVLLAAAGASRAAATAAPDLPASATASAKTPTGLRQALPARESRPTWGELGAAQRQALAPLAASWSGLGAAHKRKWLVLSANYGELNAEERQRLHGRMAQWAALSPQQRLRARQNWFVMQSVPKGQRRARWEAYQALPAEQKRRLAAQARASRPQAPPTAAALRPVPRRKLARVPHAQAAASLGAAPAPDPETLLPPAGALAPLP